MGVVQGRGVGTSFSEFLRPSLPRPDEVVAERGKEVPILTGHFDPKCYDQSSLGKTAKQIYSPFSMSDGWRAMVSGGALSDVWRTCKEKARRGSRRGTELIAR